MSDTEKMKADATEMAKQIAKELMAEQAKFFQDEMKKTQDLWWWKEEVQEEVLLWVW